MLSIASHPEYRPPLCVNNVTGQRAKRTGHAVALRSGEAGCRRMEEFMEAIHHILDPSNNTLSKAAIFASKLLEHRNPAVNINHRISQHFLYCVIGVKTRTCFLIFINLLRPERIIRMRFDMIDDLSVDIWVSCLHPMESLMPEYERKTGAWVSLQIGYAVCVPSAYRPSIATEEPHRNAHLSAKFSNGFLLAAKFMVRYNLCVGPCFFKCSIIVAIIASSVLRCRCGSVIRYSSYNDMVIAMVWCLAILLGFFIL